MTIYDRTDPSKGFTKHLFRAGKGLQSAELNELQTIAQQRHAALGNALFKDGDLVRDCQCFVDTDTGDVNLNSGLLFLRGEVWSVGTAQFVIPLDQVLSIGIWLHDTIVTELDDPTLRDPAVGTRNFGEAGAARQKTTQTWGWDSDGSLGEFYPVYTVENGVLLSKEPPPAFDSMTQAIARYDRDSAGGLYIVEGLAIKSTYNRITEKVTILVGEGSARVKGYPVNVARGIRLTLDADPDLKAVNGEPNTYTPSGLTGAMRVDLDNSPLVEITEVQGTVEKTVTLTHGAFSGAADPLPDNAVLAIIEVKQGGTTYTQGTDYILNSGDVDWSPGGAEPAPGSSYTVKYQYITTTDFTVTDIDDTGFSVSGLVSGTVFTTKYIFAMPRIDAVVLDTAGRVIRLKGVASQYAPSEPFIPEGFLRIGGLYHDWFGDPRVLSDAVVVMPMDQIQGMRRMLTDLFDLVAQERLRNDVALSDQSAKRGVFVDPFTNDNLRDAGITQNLAVIDGELMLPINGTVFDLTPDVPEPDKAILLNYTLEAVVDQPYRTGSMLINPYQAFEPLPATLVLKPAVDFWTIVQTNWTSPITRRFIQGWGNFVASTVQVDSVQVLNTTTLSAEFLRQIDVEFQISGFGAGEILDSMTFDGVPVTPVGI